MLLYNFLILFTTLLFCSKNAAGGETVRIKSADDFSSFVSNVSSNINYEGTTVYLDTDLSLTGKTLDPIGNGSRYFSGTFDGQGHIISNLKMNITSYYTGLFGYSNRLTIKNVVLDSSCFMSNSYNGSNDAYVGGIIGYCYASSGKCTIENNVNMADTTFSGNISGYNSLYLGGIAGYLSSSGHMKNCANYGSVTHSGTTSRSSYIGGIVGDFDGYCSNNICTCLYNCLNYGTVTHSGTTSAWLYIGGIAGYAYSTHIENCVSAGKISSTKTAAYRNYIGSIMGDASSYAHINYCYYTSGLSEYSSYGGGTLTNIAGTTSYDNVTFKLGGTVSIGGDTKNTLIDALNAYSDYYVLRDYPKWLLNKDSKDVKFTINSRANPITMNYKIILFPSLASEGTLMFDGWYTDSNCKNLLQSFEITEDKELCGRFKENTKEYTITFDARREGISVESITTQFGTVVSLPSDSIREHCSVAWWENKYGDYVGLSLTMPAHDFTLYANKWKCIHITSPDDFIDFSSLVNSGTTYYGTTVYLGTDLSLTGKSLEPIGDNNQFRGIFDGQGHIISNLKINTSSSQYTGLFGYSNGLTIKNVVLDSSCSITNSYSGSRDVYAGGIIGYCESDYRQCTIENSVNMADVTFSGDTSSTYYLRLGGIAGHLSSSGNVKNCANYGSVTHSGYSYYSYIGGIVGYLDDASSSPSTYKYIQICLNYGAVTHSGTTSNDLYIGGVAGYTSSTYIENCVSAGKISSTKATTYGNCIGSIVGQVKSRTFINYCYYANDTGTKKLYGSGAPQISSYTFNYDNVTFKLGGYVSIGSYTGDSLIDALNAYSNYCFLRDYSNWLLNKDNKNVKFTINSRINPITMDYKIILLPTLASEGNITFDGWYTDSNCKNPLQSFETTEDKELYGRFEENTKEYTITFDTKKDGVHIEPQTARYLAVVPLPSNSTREHCNISSWESEYGDDFGFNLTMPAHDVTLYAVWKCTRIATPDDLIDFSRIVKEGTSYLGTTVYLDSDLSLTGKSFKTIGNSSRYFRGTFDGQGYIISNLKISNSLYYIGLFGYSNRLTIKNVVLDSSCSVSNSYSSVREAYVGGIIGYCQSNNGQCTIENAVNMADVTFSGNIGYGSLCLGGIAGYLSSSYQIHAKNCANYGSVTHSGTSGSSYIGGVTGYFSGSIYAFLYNCLNYGAITHSGTTSNDLYIGGIVGYAYSTQIENCVSAGKISSTKTDYVGSIVGYVYSCTYINYCYYTSELNEYNIYGDTCYSLPNISYTTSYDNTTFGLSGTVSIGSSTKDTLIDALNAYSDYYVLRDYSKWLLNKNNRNVKITINSRANPITMDYKIVILLALVSEGNITFDGWYTDSNYKNPLQSFEITEDKELYGRFEENTNKYTITFDTRGGTSVVSKSVKFGTVVSLPSGLTRGYCSISFWENKYGDNVGFSLAMPAHDFTLYAVWKCTHITTPDDLIDFSKVVNKGDTYYYGTTVYLDTDLSLTGKTLEPIGKGNKYFLGTFDGQGYIISNIKMDVSSSLLYTGLFGYSKELTIKNVVLDSSCSITNSYGISRETYLGGIIGACATSNGECNIENSVNMVDVTFNTNYSGYNSLYLGGVVGFLSSGYVKNCANYGSVTHSGSSSYSYIGGIAGFLRSYSSSYSAYTQNCLNYGAITHSGTTTYDLNIGGIAGYTSYTYLENCVSAGEVSSTKTDYLGSIVGQVKSVTSINYCYYTSDVGEYQINGTGAPESIEGTPDSPTTADLSLVSNLNSRVTSDNGWNKWLLNANNKAVSFKMNANDDFSLSSTLIILPNLASGWRTFVAWFTDSTFITPFSESSVSADTTLYGRWDIFTVTFDGNGGNVSEIPRNVAYDSAYGELPEANRTGYTLEGWFTEGSERITSSTALEIPSDHTIYAHWVKNKYTVTLDVNGGDRLSDNNITVTFNETYGNLPTPKRKGYTFVGWFTEGSELITSSTTLEILSNHTLNAHWEVNNYTVTLDVNGGDELSDNNITVTFDKVYGNLPTPTRNLYTFVGWFTGDNEIVTNETVVSIGGDHTLHAHWSGFKYTVTLDVNEGDELPDNKITVTFDEVYGNLPEPNRTGYTFVGWFTDDNVVVTNETVVSIAGNHTLHARWTDTNFDYVGALYPFMKLVYFLV